MLAYCVFNASSAAVSLYQPLTVKFLKNTRHWIREKTPHFSSMTSQPTLSLYHMEYSNY